MNHTPSPANSQAPGLSEHPDSTPFRQIPFLLPELRQALRHMIAASTTLLDHTEFDAILSGHGDTGTVTMQSDLTLNQQYLEYAASQGRFAFSEESDPKNSNGAPARLGQRFIDQRDPVDGSGDRKFGAPGTASQMGFTSLASFVEDGVVTAGICIRPAHREAWLFHEQGIERYQIAENFRQMTRVPYSAADQQNISGDNRHEIRVNFRPAYPGTNIPESVLERASELSAGRYRFVYRESGGAGDSLCRLLTGDLDIVLSGRKTDWKSWDTDPFVPALRHFGTSGVMTSYQGDPLNRRADRDLDLWHTSGVIASIANREAHQFLCAAIIESRTDTSIGKDGRPLIYDPRLITSNG